MAIAVIRPAITYVDYVNNIIRDQTYDAGINSSGAPNIYNNTIYNNLYAVFIPLPEHRKSTKDEDWNIKNELYERYWCCTELYYNNDILEWKLLTKCMITELKKIKKYKLISWYKESKLIYEKWSWIWYKDISNIHKFTDFDSSFTTLTKNEFAEEIIKKNINYTIWLRFKSIFDLIEEIIKDYKK